MIDFSIEFIEERQHETVFILRARGSAYENPSRSAPLLAAFPKACKLLGVN